MPLSGLVLNRMHAGSPGGISEDEARAAIERLADLREHRLTSALLRIHADRLTLANQDKRMADRFAAAHPLVPVTHVPALAGDVHDLSGLRQMGQLFAE